MIWTIWKPGGRRRRILGALLLVFLALGAATIAAQSRSYDDATDVVVIEVPVHVIKGGEPVRGLDRGNFELYVGGKKQKLLDFETIDLTTLGAVPALEAVQTLPVVARRHFLLLFDLTFARPLGVNRARIAARELVLDGLHPSDLVGVATYNEAVGAQVILGFTSDRRQIDLALATLGNINPAERIRDPLGIIMADYKVFMEEFGGYGADELRRSPGGYALIPNAQFLNNIKDIVSMSDKAARSEVRNQILALSSSLSGLADQLAAVKGRKHVVYFSEGFDSTSLLGTDDTARIQELNKESSFGQLWRVDSDVRYGDTGTQIGVFDMLDHFKRCDCTIQSVDTSGLSGTAGIDSRPSGEFGGRAAGEDALFVMAEQTGGELYRNYNDLSAAMESMLERTSLTYLLSWQTDEPGEPGRFYPIRVKLKGGPKGARLTHRSGYYAPKPYGSLSAEERRFQTIELMMAGREGGTIEASLLTAPFKMSGTKADVLTLLEIEGYSLLRGHQGTVVPTEVIAYAIDESGSVADFLGQAIELDLEKVQAALNSRGFKFLGHLELEPGSYEVRVLVRNALTGANGMRVSQVEVPAFDQASLLPPFFIEPEGTWLIGEEQRSGGDPRSYPLTFGRQTLVPAARPYLRSGVETPVLLVGHNLERGGLIGGCRLVPLDGSGPLEMGLTVEHRSPTGVAGVERLTAKIGPGDAPPGEYRLEVTLRGSESREEVTSAIPVRVY